MYFSISNRHRNDDAPGFALVASDAWEVLRQSVRIGPGDGSGASSEFPLSTASYSYTHFDAESSRLPGADKPSSSSPSSWWMRLETFSFSYPCSSSCSGYATSLVGTTDLDG